MISKLRLKFVLYTVILFALCFAILISATIIYNKLTFYQDTYQELCWLGDTGPQFHSDSDYSDKLNFDILYYGYNPIYCLKADENKNIISSKVIGGNNPSMLPHEVSDRILSSCYDDWIVDSFVFYQKKLNDKSTLYIITDCASKAETQSIVAKVIMAITALLLITGISIFLSTFVTKPAKLAIMHEKQVTSDISHKLKNPIAAIQVNLHALALEGISSSHLDNAQEETNKMRNLVKEMLSLSRSERMEYSSNHQPFNLSDLIEKLAFTYESIAFEKNIILKSSIDANITCKGNINEIENAVAMILDNAIKYTPAGGSIILSLYKRGSKSLITIADTGIGIPLEDMPYIFDRFYVSDKSRTGNSFGLGLTIAKTIINKHGGSISVNSIEGSGSQFEIKI